MTPRFARRTRLAALTLAATLPLAACGGSDDSADDAESGDGGSSFPVTITSSLGETTIEAEPQSPAAVGWGSQDVALALGVVPVGMPSFAYGDDDGDGILPWTYDALEDAGATGDDTPALYDETDGVDFEAVADAAPDVVLATYSGISAEDFTTLSEIAPTVGYPDAPWGTKWRDLVTINGEALGLADEAEELVADLEDEMSSGFDEYPQLDGKTFAFTYVNPADTSTVPVYTPLDARVSYVSDLGLEVPQSVSDLDNGEDFYAEVSAENADTIDADIMITYGDDSTLQMLQDDPLLSKIPAVASGAVVVLEDGSPLAGAVSPPTPLSIEWALDDYLELLGDAADAADAAS
ncbi:iron complex transport system substrate-binding protein [Mumia flava]|uniref:Iron complex transport system substrate-binding protein n=1 Tax=Mumia flava TaxID=1348852 RepID=A0A0B2BAY8_9ACTN|nr:iron-siderophore ABC transporter substrate-binding protein [Mumia flava]PJJ53838.1 iron complex transport system substrate-binding protein [Mumia flava]